MSGGGLPFGGKFHSYYVMLQITDKQNVTAIDERRTVLLGVGNKPKNNDHHITLLEFKINPNYAYYIKPILTDASFHQFVRDSFIKNLNGTTLKHVQQDYELLGKTPINKFYGKKYKLDQQEEHRITDFRRDIYSEIQRRLGNPKVDFDKTDPEYVIFKYNGADMIAVPSYSWGAGNWTPHLSILNMGDIKNNNIQLYNSLIDPNIKNQLAPNAITTLHNYIGTNMPYVLSQLNATNSQGHARTGVFPLTDIILYYNPKNIKISYSSAPNLQNEEWLI